MRLQPAVDLDEFEESVSGFGYREDRRERREARRMRRREKRADRREDRSERRADRRERRGGRRLERVERRQELTRERLSRASSGPAPRRAGQEPTLQPAPAAFPPDLEPPEEEGGWVDDLVEQAEELLEDEGEATEGMGAWRPFQRRRAAPPPRGAAPKPSKAPADGAWGPAVRLGRKLRIQAALGHRAAVIDLKPGLYLVAELPEEVTRTEFGLAPILAPLMITAARRALEEPPRERRGPLAALFRRRREEPVRYVQVQAPPAPSPAPLALPGPVADGPAVVAAPNVGWADDATVAAAYGCECDRGRR